MAGPREGSQPLRDHITAVLEPAKFIAETLSRLTTRLVCTLALRSQASTQKLCLANGNFKSVLARELSVRRFSSLLLKRLELTFQSG